MRTKYRDLSNALDLWDEQSRQRRRWWKKLLVAAGSVIAVILTAVFIAVLVIYLRLAAGLPDVSDLETYQPSLVTEVYDRDEQLIGEFFIEKRRLVPLEEVPLYVRQATIATEDSRFYIHTGVDIAGIVRAALVNWRAGETREGASTITQQVARSLFLTQERTLNRKLREAILANRIEQRYSKDRILQIYLNQIFYGHNAYGIEAAAQLYFGKAAKDLTLAEGALIAGLPPAPNTYSPLKNRERSLQRRTHVLRRMVEEGYLTPEAAEAANQEALNLNPAGLIKKRVNKAPYFVEYVRQYLEEKYGPNELYRGGFTVHTTLDMRLQRMAEDTVQEGLLRLDKYLRPGVYPGPFRRLELTQSETWNTAMIEAITLPEDEETTVREGERLLGVVLEATDSSVLVHIKSSRGRIPSSGLSWVRRVTSMKGLRYPRPSRFLQRGDVIRVRVTKVDRAGIMHELALVRDPIIQSALLTMEVGTGHVLAMVGGYDFIGSQFNRAAQAQRQPGSSFKPIIYAAAVESGMKTTSIVNDRPFTKVMRGPRGVEVWTPKNADGKYLGPITLRTALTRSRNLATVDVMQKVGVKKVCAYAKQLGIQSRIPCYHSLALGSMGVNLLELTAVYGVFANSGVYVEPVFITKIVDRYGQMKEENLQRAWRAMSPEVAYTVTSMMQSVIQQGTGRHARALRRPTAGKTGTTNDSNDAWFMGFTPELVTGSWVGFDDNKPLPRGSTGGKVALPFWLAFMQEALKDRPREDFPIPPGIRFVRQVGSKSGKPPTQWNADLVSRFEVLIDENHGLDVGSPFNAEGAAETIEDLVIADEVVPDTAETSIVTSVTAGTYPPPTAATNALSSGASAAATDEEAADDEASADADEPMVDDEAPADADGPITEEQAAEEDEDTDEEATPTPGTASVGSTPLASGTVFTPVEPGSSLHNTLPTGSVAPTPGTATPGSVTTPQSPNQTAVPTPRVATTKAPVPAQPRPPQSPSRRELHQLDRQLR
jgi:penicillin-binding protein 1A